jgi:hypothetical protein
VRSSIRHLGEASAGLRCTDQVVTTVINGIGPARERYPARLSRPRASCPATVRCGRRSAQTRQPEQVQQFAMVGDDVVGSSVGMFLRALVGVERIVRRPSSRAPKTSRCTSLPTWTASSAATPSASRAYRNRRGSGLRKPCPRRRRSGRSSRAARPGATRPGRWRPAHPSPPPAGAGCAGRRAPHGRAGRAAAAGVISRGSTRRGTVAAARTSRGAARACRRWRSRRGSCA